MGLSSYNLYLIILFAFAPRLSKSELQCAPGNYSKQLQGLLRSLYYSVKYFERSYTDLTFEGLFGLFVLADSSHYLCNAAVLPHCFSNELCELSVYAKKVVKKAKNYLVESHSTEFSNLGFLSNISWIPSLYLHQVELSNMPTLDYELNEKQSDSCFSEIPHFKNGNCNISSECNSVFLSNILRGYGLTHQALYIWLLTKIGCYRSDELMYKIEYYQRMTCSNVVLEFDKLKPLMNNSTLQRDLGLEQIFICGLGGYFEIVDLELLNMIFKWQDPSGCFKSVPKENVIDPGSRNLLYEYILKDNCLAHLSTVAVCALTIYMFRFVMDVPGISSIRLSLIRESVEYENRFLPSLTDASPLFEEPGKYAKPYAVVPDSVAMMTNKVSPYIQWTMHHDRIHKSYRSYVCILIFSIAVIYCLRRYLRSCFRRWNY